jgi:hypothetical protein
MRPAEPTGVAGPDIDDTVIVGRTADEQTRIVRRANDDHTRRVVRQPPTEAGDSATTPHEDDATADQADEATVQSSRGSTATDTLLSQRRATAPVHTPVVDSLQRRYQPPQVQSGASVRYAARPTPTIISPQAPVPRPDVLPDLARLRLADAAAEIRERAEVIKRRRRRFTLMAIISSTVLVVLAAAAYTVFTIFTW